MNNKRGWRERLQGWENVILRAIAEWIIQRCGVEFVWWIAPDEFDAYAKDDDGEGEADFNIICHCPEPDGRLVMMQGGRVIQVAPEHTDGFIEALRHYITDGYPFMFDGATGREREL